MNKLHEAAIDELSFKCVFEHIHRGPYSELQNGKFAGVVLNEDLILSDIKSAHFLS